MKTQKKLEAAVRIAALAAEEARERADDADDEASRQNCILEDRVWELDEANKALSQFLEEP